MAKKKAAGADDKPKKKKSAKAGAASSRKPGKKSGRAKSGASSVDAILKLAEHPIVADLIAVGATAAVAAIAGSRSGKGSVNPAKAAGKAAASAIGARLVEEFKAVKQSAGEAARKRDQK